MTPFRPDGEAPVVAEAMLAHVAQTGPEGTGRTVVIITLSGGTVSVREALGDRVIAAARAALAPEPPENRLAAVFARLTHPPARTSADALTETLATGTTLPSTPTPAPVSPYEAPFVLAPLRRRDG